MTQYNRPSEEVFASGAKPGEVQNFPNIARGWGVAFDQTAGIPPMEWFNALFQRTDEALRYLMQRGVPEWSATEDYPVGAYVQDGGKTWKAKVANINKKPSTNAASWVEWGLTRDDMNTAFAAASHTHSFASLTGKPTTLAGYGITDAVVPLFSVQWWPSRAAIPAGFAPADGQALPRATWPDAWAGIQAGNVPTVAEATWQSTPSERGKFTSGDGSSTFRLPDYNGKAGGSLGALFLRGDGALSAAVAGAIQADEIRSHSHSINSASGGTTTRHAYANQVGGLGDIGGTYSTYDKGGAETRPLNVTGCWIIRLHGAVTNPGSANAAQLATDYAALVARVAALEGRPRALGDNQQWLDMTAQRALGTTYTNPTNQLIKVRVTVQVSTSSGGSLIAQVNGSSVDRGTQSYLGNAPTSNDVEVPPGGTYRFSMGSGSGSILSWWELR